MSSTVKKIASAVIGTGLLVTAPAANSATSAGLTVSGTVQPILSLTVTPTASATGLDLTGLVSQLKVATVLAKSNNPTGYTVSVSSGNQSGTNCTVTNGPCFYSPTAAANLPFSMLNGAVNVSFTGANGTFKSSSARSVVAGDSYDAKVSYDGTLANLPQATNYSETLTFTVSNQ
jgi:hypothetical protein